MGDYISREELLSLYEDKDINPAQWSVPLSVVIQNIKDVPAADVAPVVHGEWIDDQQSIFNGVIERHCSRCGQLMTSAITRKMHYCPNCGARMDGGGSDG